VGLLAILQVCHQLVCLSLSHQASDIILVRMTSDLIRQPDKRYNYSNAITGLINLIKTEGARGLGRGISTNTVRCEFYL